VLTHRPEGRRAHFLKLRRNRLRSTCRGHQIPRRERHGRGPHRCRTQPLRHRAQDHAEQHDDDRATDDHRDRRPPGRGPRRACRSRKSWMNRSGRCLPAIAPPRMVSASAATMPSVEPIHSHRISGVTALLIAVVATDADDLYRVAGRVFIGSLSRRGGCGPARCSAARCPGWLRSRRG